MVVLANSPVEPISFMKPYKAHPHFIDIPVIDPSKPGCEADIVKACKDYGFFKVTNHGVSKELMARLEAEAVKFFSLAETEKEKAGSANPFGYGNKKIGFKGDAGWVEYLLFEINSKPMSETSLSFLTEPSASLFRSAMNEYLSALRNLGGKVLELMGEGLAIEPRDALSKLVMNDESSLMFRINHYPPWAKLKQEKDEDNDDNDNDDDDEEVDYSLTGFGEHTDPQMISILRSNNSNGFQIALRDGTWVSVPPDQDSFFINAGDMLQVLTNGRFRSVRHRVLTNGSKSRLSMIFFAGPPPNQVITPLPQLMIKGGEGEGEGEGEEETRSRYKEFTWAEYIKAAYETKLVDNRLSLVEQ